MRFDQLEHAIRAACDVAEDKELLPCLQAGKAGHEGVQVTALERTTLQQVNLWLTGIRTENLLQIC